LGPFWAFELGGCNMNSFAPSRYRGTDNPTCTAQTFWISTGSTVDPYFDFKRHGNRAVFVWAYSRTTSVPLIAAGTNVYALTIVFDEANVPGAGGENCEGCTDNVAWVLNEIDIGSTTQPLVSETTPGLRGNCVTVNGANPALCAATPVLKPTWG